MKTAKQKSFHSIKKLWFYIFMLVLLLILGNVFLTILRNTLLQNYKDLGTSMAQRYNAEVERELNS